MIKHIDYIVKFIFFFIFVIHANGSQVDLSNNNQVLSSIYSEYNNVPLRLPKSMEDSNYYEEHRKKIQN